jgi:pantoate--beta-alanine ligase
MPLPVWVQPTGMRIVRTVLGMRRLAGRWRSESASLGLVPTMGWLHAGHLSLVHAARRAAGRSGKVVVSIYVNPTQFGPREDFSKYPRDLTRDAALCRDAGVDCIFAPSDQEMYPAAGEDHFSTYVVEERLSRGMEGASRPTHFRGVATVVTKLFNIVEPDVAVFGQKDYQQAAVIRRMVRDLNFRVRIHVAPTIREKDGLAMSSRNQYLTASERPQAAALWMAIRHAQERVAGSGPRGLAAERLQREMTDLIQKHPDARVDYISFFDADSLEPVRKVSSGRHVALAVLVGKTRLIDNARL